MPSTPATLSIGPQPNSGARWLRLRDLRQLTCVDQSLPFPGAQAIPKTVCRTLGARRRSDPLGIVPHLSYPTNPHCPHGQRLEVDLAVVLLSFGEVKSAQLASSWEVICIALASPAPPLDNLNHICHRYTVQMSPLGSPRDPAMPCAGDGDIEPASTASAPDRQARRGPTPCEKLAHFALFGTADRGTGGG